MLKADLSVDYKEIDMYDQREVSQQLSEKISQVLHKMM